MLNSIHMKFISSICLFVLSSLWLSAAPSITLTNKNGQSFEAELLTIQDKVVTVRRSSDQKVFTLKRSTLDKKTNAALKEAHKKLPVVHPEYDLDVIIGKRSRSLNNNSRRKSQEVSCTVRVINTDREIHSPGVKGRAIFLGKELERHEVYQVLATRNFKASPAPDETTELDLNSFKTEYYKSYSEHGTIYEAHIIILYGKDSEVLFYKSPDAIFQKAVENNIGLLEVFRTIKPQTYVNKEMQRIDYKGNLINNGKH